MRLRTVQLSDGPAPCVRLRDGRLARIDRLLPDAPRDLLALLESERLDALAAVVDGTAAVADDYCVDTEAPVLAPWTRPRKILGIGLNYGAHAGDLGEQAPRSSPASFLKGDHTIVGPGRPIVVPPGIGKVTAEAELGLVIGRTCHQVGVDEALSYVAGVVPVLDQTAESVLMENPRYLTRVKNYPTFFAFGPELITLDEVLAHGPLSDLQVATIHNGAVHRKDTVAGMTFSPAELLSFHSQVMPFYPGDILSTGTPGAVGISPGDVVRCELGDGLAALTNPVR
ncbi:2-keto-4-pentenoate hydratase/2-oxohepta-3-ene-1,7-dioic acid hydratase (catechol pathway) [Mycolicibacterium rutilum]|uniref:2-keto-4-pentenoate hydratase/2-oxohepta-3-ene-1,7-dioic acid hydratase (Catechol pathway) n=1 Tax=Mycolicibacterium rutilum TaxID=370526 RepID=A0A1H6KNR7_MYCRU|nr:fumarylacetoacetate hydrolase family protein [Mycolicibacterium rutilum]SEH77377.1 2-keto-4-pentenoate hydratase/2-oxohepta-3-ene-1,7-dioic acid hydratase (catechol pathway) [Mycolicibacterium rutilum]